MKETILPFYKNGKIFWKFPNNWRILTVMIIVGRTAWAGKWIYMPRFPYEMCISVDDRVDEFVAALSADQMVFTVVDRTGAVAAECHAKPIPGFFKSWNRVPDVFIKDAISKEPMITISPAGWFKKKIAWASFESTYRHLRRHGYIEPLGIDWKVDNRSFRAVCEKPSSGLAKHMLIAVLYYEWVSFARFNES